MTPHKRFKGTACVECRQQKLRCDAPLHPSNGCSRCRKIGIDCEMSDTFHRKPRKTKAQMQREIDELRRQAERSSYNLTDRNASSTFVPPPHSQDVLDGHVHTVLSPRSNAATLPQSLDGISFEPRKIDDCFSLFFQHYFPSLPILEPDEKDPNWYHEHCPLLFWAIIATGSRKYYQDPTILEGLTPRVTSLVIPSMANPHRHIPVIQSLLLLCTWPFPMDTVMADMSPSWAGLAMQLAMQNGLHFFKKKQDFTTQIAPNPVDIGFRARLWSYCKVVFQMTNICNGLQPLSITDSFECPTSQPQDFIRICGPHVFWSQKLLGALAEAISTLMNKVYPADNGSLSFIVDAFDDKVLEISWQGDTYLDKMMILGARLHIRAFHFFEHDKFQSYPRLVMEVHRLACSFIERVTMADQTDDYAMYSSEYIYRTLNVAACTILRIAWSSLQRKVDREAGERAYFSCIQILKRRMIRNNDLNGRTAEILTQLWRNPHTFKRKDATHNSLAVRIRTRGSIGIFYDCFWCWQREFNGQTDPYFDSMDDAATRPSGEPIAGMPVESVADDPMESAALGDDEQLLPLLENYFFPDESCFLADIHNSAAP
ncbi:uncharacterized protein N7459_000117 [Penicillium hispanicum]|uniref:uncharacterized protein n=1 Tax=Penicillium hispanicum TaxID=1080232 RepID=UPI0025404C5F|nr:uncharacterized protein N7459_000117 [Penicillium hispanicum]KAJ5593909.1 hypothetical protein N7459_000117 [Penicillium hispanicum]